MSEQETDTLVTEKVLELKLKALKSDLRLLIIASVALNQFLTNVELPAGVGVAAIGAAIFAPVFKAAFLFIGGRA